jgi:hypothetical protein
MPLVSKIIVNSNNLVWCALHANVQRVTRPMAKFLAVFTGSQDSASSQAFNALDEAQKMQTMQAGMQAWGEWMAKHESCIVDAGGPLGGTKLVDANGAHDISNSLSAYIIVEADSHAAAAQLFENHPHFSIFPGDGVEVMPCVPMPG